MIHLTYLKILLLIAGIVKHSCPVSLLLVVALWMHEGGVTHHCIICFTLIFDLLLTLSAVSAVSSRSISLKEVTRPFGYNLSWVQTIHQGNIKSLLSVHRFRKPLHFFSRRKWLCPIQKFNQNKIS